MNQIASSAQATPDATKVAPSSAGHPARPASFSPQEIAGLHAEDRHRAAAIVGLMAGIFTIGLVGYILICFWVVGSE